METWILGNWIQCSPWDLESVAAICLCNGRKVISSARSGSFTQGWARLSVSCECGQDADLANQLAFPSRSMLALVCACNLLRCAPRATHKQVSNINQGTPSKLIIELPIGTGTRIQPRNRGSDAHHLGLRCPWRPTDPYNSRRSGAASPHRQLFYQRTRIHLHRTFCPFTRQQWRPRTPMSRRPFPFRSPTRPSSPPRMRLPIHPPRAVHERPPMPRSRLHPLVFAQQA